MDHKSVFGGSVAGDFPAGTGAIGSMPAGRGGGGRAPAGNTVLDRRQARHQAYLEERHDLVSLEGRQRYVERVGLYVEIALDVIVVAGLEVAGGSQAD